jgi:RNA polymerase sigma-70 factor (ECF subfamily)
MPDTGEETKSNPLFTATHWSVVLRAGTPDSPEGRAALAHLFEVYWYPLYAFVRRQGWSPHDAQDLTQSFLESLLRRNSLSDLRPERGRFRSFLMSSAKHFLANEWDKLRAQKRGGNLETFSLDAVAAEERYALEPVDNTTPEMLFDRGWAESVVDHVTRRLRALFEADGEIEKFEVLKAFLMGDSAQATYTAAAERLGMSVSAVTSAIHRLRLRFRDLFREEIAETVDTSDEIDEEIRHLVSVLSA